MRTNVYVDGFNLYHSIEEQIKDGICLYPSLRMLCKNILDSVVGIEYELEEIHYCTAKVHPTKNDPGKLDRQEKYIEAIEKENKKKTHIHYGAFVPKSKASEPVRCGFCGAAPRENEKCESCGALPSEPKWKEKRSDVNLAVHLLNDAWRNKYDCAVIVSGDADYHGAIKLVKKSFPGKPRKRVEVWAVGAIANDIDGVADECRTILDVDLLRAKQIANFGFNPKGVKSP